MNRARQLLFDLDGTLGDTLPMCIRAFREALEPMIGRTLPDAEIIATFGPSEEGTIAALLADGHERGVDAYLERYTSLHPSCPDPFDGVRELLGELRAAGRFVGLVTGKGPRSTAVTLRQYGMHDAFDAVETGDPRGPIKAECMRKILQEHGLDPHETAYVGDSPSDVTASHACGLLAIGAAWASTTDAEALRAAGADRVFTTVAELRAFLFVDEP